MRHRVVFVVGVALLLAGCANREELRLARRRLHPIGCADTPAVAGVAGVNEDPHQVFLGDWILISVCHLDELLKASDAAQAPITLYVEGKDTGVQPTGIDVDSGTLTFILDRNKSNRELWRPYLYSPLFDATVTMRLSAGIRGERPLPRAVGANMTVELRKVYVDWSTELWATFLILFAIVLGVLATRTDMLRESGRYSLARSQMAFWFFIVVVSFAFIWIVTGDRDTLPPSVLALLGISSATALVASVIPERTTAQSSSGWRDLIVDNEGRVALERVQVVIWTVILGGIFLTSVLWDLTMPELDAGLLALMGISSGTYLGFRRRAPEEPEVR